MDINKNEIFIPNNTPKRKDIERIPTINYQEKKNNYNQNKIRILIKNNSNPNKLNQMKYNRLNNNTVNDININNIKEKQQNNKCLFMRNNKIDSLNEITLNSLAQENNLLKKEIEIVKSNLIISDEKEQLHKRTIQQIKKMNKEKEISYKNSINIINEYKKREIGLINKIKEMEIDFSKKKRRIK